MIVGVYDSNRDYVLPLEEAAAVLNVSIGTIRRILNGKSAPLPGVLLVQLPKETILRRPEDGNG